MNSTIWKRLWHELAGQDLIEYALLMAFIGLSTAALVIGPTDINFVWTNDNTELTRAASAVTSR